MKVSKNWLQDYIIEQLPSVEEIADALTMHAFEIEEIIKVEGDDVIDVKTLPDRNHYALSHRGIASEIAVVMGLTLKPKVDVVLPAASNELSVQVENEKLCRRYVGVVAKNVKVGPSPEWLVKRLNAVGQRSINNVVDATNYVMLSVGQPLHAFDADKLQIKDGKVSIAVAELSAPEKVALLDGNEYELKVGTLVIADGNSKQTLAIAGVKGGAFAQVTDITKNLILESANFDPTIVSKTSRSLGLLNDSSKRFENEITPELAGEGMTMLVTLLKDIASVEIEGCVDTYPKPVKNYKVGVSLFEINSVLGMTLAESNVEAILTKFKFDYTKITPREHVLSLVEKYLSAPYKLGASVLYDAPEAFDCSSFTAWLYKEAGVAIPRLSIDQYVYGISVSKEELQPGDLIFSHNDGKIHYETVEFLKGTKVEEGIDHVGVYVGNDEVIHATRYKNGVVKEKIANSEQFKTVIGYRKMLRSEEARYVVTVPHERIDIRLKEDLIEEIGRIYGYDKVVLSMPQKTTAVIPNKLYYWSEKFREALKSKGFSEVYTYAFRAEGEVELANPLASDKKFLRKNLTPGVTESLAFNLRNADVLGVDQLKIFEIGAVFNGGREYNALSLAIGNTKGFKGESVNETVRNARENLITDLGLPLTTVCTIDDTGGLIMLNNKEIGVINNVDGVMEIDFDALVAGLPDPIESLPTAELSQVTYSPISPYPCMLRDIAVWVPGGTGREGEVLDVVKSHAGNLLVGARIFDTFTKRKEGELVRTSYAYHLVFQSQEKTLTDEEVNGIMNKVTETLNSNEGWQVR